MREKTKDFLRSVFGSQTVNSLLKRAKLLRELIYLITNYYADFILYYQHSNVFKIHGVKKEEAQLILNYHSIEKGMLNLNMKPRFGLHRIIKLHQQFKSQNLLKNLDRSQINVTIRVLCKYYEIHKEMKVNIEDYYSLEQYEYYQELLSDEYDPNFCGAIDTTYKNFYKNVNMPFNEFAFSRKSVRNFTGENIEHQLIRNAISLALSAPSVCNRQANSVYLLEDKIKIDEVLKIQGGFRGYEKNVNQLLVVTNNRNYYYTVGERNQFYIDGGVFLLNLLYSLYHYKIASCPANWGKLMRDEKELEKIISIPKAEKIICLIPIGVAEENFRVTLSKRRTIDETLKFL